MEMSWKVTPTVNSVVVNYSCLSTLCGALSWRAPNQQIKIFVFNCIFYLYVSTKFEHLFLGNWIHRTNNIQCTKSLPDVFQIKKYLVLLVTDMCFTSLLIIFIRYILSFLLCVIWPRLRVYCSLRRMKG